MLRHELKSLLFSIVFALAILFVLRTGFYLYFSPADAPLETSILIQSLYIGSKFDLRLLLFLHLPLVILSFIPVFRVTSNCYTLYFWRLYFILGFIALMAIYMLDFGHFAYLETRLDASVLRFAYNLDTSLQMVWQTYPVLWISLAYILSTSVIIIGVLKLWPYRNNLVYPAWWKSSLISLGIIAMMLPGIWGKASWYPLRWSDAFYSTNDFASRLALNPVLYFIDTLKNQNIDYDENKVRKHYPWLVKYLGIEKPGITNLSFARDFKPTTEFAHQPNVVIVLLESFAWYKTGLSGNPFNPTPNFDAIANKGISFNRYYAPHGGTARSVWALMTGLPDIEINKTSSRNPLIVDQHTIFNEFQNYEKLYFLGGSASWANIRGLLSNNIPGLKVYEEGSYQSPRMDVWGISDLHLFEEANQVLKQQDKPFIALIQTSGNHRPYNIPEDNRGFEKTSPDADKLKQHGFRSVADYNAMRFMDHAIGFFLREAEKESYFADTVFVFLADHGNTRHATHLPDYVEKLGITEFQSPLVIYKQGLQPARIDRLASQIDVLPTVAAFVNQKHQNTTLGRNILDSRFDEYQYVFTVMFDHLPRIGILAKNHYYSMYSDGSKQRLHLLDSPQPERNIIEEDPEIAREMASVAEALYEANNYIRYHNKKEKAEN